MPLIRQAMIQAAGLGRRLRPLTLDAPKPLLKVGGRKLIDLAIETLTANGVEKIAINTHYLADQLTNHLGAYNSPDIRLSFEEKLLDTGGGIKKACETYLRNDEAVFCLSSDWVWEDGKDNPYFWELARKWNPDKMDILLLLIPVGAIRRTTVTGDYDVDDNGLAIRSAHQTGRYMWSSVRIFHPRIFQGTPSGPFSFLELMDKAESQGRLFAHCLPDRPCAEWHHISTIDDYSAVRAHLKNRTGNARTPQAAGA